MTTLDLDTPLPDDIESAHRLIRELLVSLHQQAHLNENLQHQLEQLLRRLYGKKSEKLDPNQLLLFAREILQAGTTEITPEPESETTSEPPTPSPAKPPIKGHGHRMDWTCMTLERPQCLATLQIPHAQCSID